MAAPLDEASEKDRKHGEDKFTHLVGPDVIPKQLQYYSIDTRSLKSGGDKSDMVKRIKYLVRTATTICPLETTY